MYQFNFIILKPILGKYFYSNLIIDRAHYLFKSYSWSIDVSACKLRSDDLKAIFF